MNNDNFCGDCAICCTWFDDILRPELKFHELDKYHHETLKDGRKVMALKEGTRHCIYLIDNQCSIHTFSPEKCSEFDCRTLPDQIAPDVLQTSMVIARGYELLKKG